MRSFCFLASTLAERGAWWPESWFGRFWVLFGLSAQIIFTARFLVQWIASERRGKSHVPVSFWYLSLIGAVMLFIYGAVWKQDLVLVLGQSIGFFVYIRNLMLIRREGRNGVVEDAA